MIAKIKQDTIMSLCTLKFLVIMTLGPIQFDLFIIGFNVQVYPLNNSYSIANYTKIWQTSVI